MVQVCEKAERLATVKVACGANVQGEGVHARPRGGHRLRLCHPRRCRLEGRNDFTALGSVVNLASRPSGEAADGEIVLDARANAALGEPTVPRVVELKDHLDPLQVFVL